MRDLLFDETPAIVLAVCRIGACPWETLENDRAGARRRALAHVRAAHPADDQAAKSLEGWLRRNGIRAVDPV